MILSELCFFRKSHMCQQAYGIERANIRKQYNDFSSLCKRLFLFVPGKACVKFELKSFKALRE